MESINQDRLENLRNVCSKHSYVTMFEDLPYINSIISPTDQVFGCLIYKSGSTSLKHTFPNWKSVKDAKMNYLLDHDEEFESYKKFVIIREPMERLASAYTDKMVTNEHTNALSDFRKAVNLLSRYLSNKNKGKLKTASFQEFLTYVVIGGHGTSKRVF